jgi:tRNA threonylcarbamoyladenosine biosynthesis protein TsaE
MTSLRLTTRSPEETLGVARVIGELVRDGDVLLLAGDLGVGKTVFARGIARGLGIEEPIVSPTFTIVREYAGRVPFVHVDIYRLETVGELYDVGFDEIVRDDAVTVIEWGDAVASMFPDCLEVRLRMAAAAVPAAATGTEAREGDHGDRRSAALDDDHRTIELTARGASWRERSEALARATVEVAARSAGS